jgi:hypothetical protein
MSTIGTQYRQPLNTVSCFLAFRNCTLGSTMSYSRLVILVWLTVWMLAVPLVHVHPEADHQHGQASHFHGGTPHTVFSSDLPCEYQASSPDDVHSVGSHSAHKFGHSEIGFSLLTSLPDRSIGKPVFSDAVIGDTLSLFASLDWKFIALAPTESPASVILPVCLSTRAPPIAV